MTIMTVDNDVRNLRNLVKHIKKCRRDVKIISFISSMKAMDYIAEHQVDILFTEICMKDISGFALNKFLKCKNANTYVIFMSTSAEYAIYAWEAHVNGYIQKPIDLDKIRLELEYAIR